CKLCVLVLDRVCTPASMPRSALSTPRDRTASQLPEPVPKTFTSTSVNAWSSRRLQVRPLPSSPPIPAIVLQTFASQGVVLSSLVFQGGVNGVIVNQGSNVSMLNCTVQQNSSDGLVVQIGSTL